MNKPTSAITFPRNSAAQPLSTARGRAIAVLLGSLFVAACAQVAVPLPWTPVPMTMQPFGVLLIGLLLGPWLGAAAMATYLLEGAARLPVFVSGFGGLLPLGPSAGYLLSYPVVAALVGLLSQGSSQKRSYFLRAVGAATLGNALILLCGASWFSLFTYGSASTVLHMAVLPFVAGDTIKVLLAAAVASGWGQLGRFHKVDTGTGG